MTQGTDEEALDALRRALLPPLRFAAADDYARAGRLKGLPGLVDTALGKARGAVDDALLQALAHAARGFDALDEADKRARVAALLAALQGPAADVAPLRGVPVRVPIVRAAPSPLIEAEPAKAPRRAPAAGIDRPPDLDVLARPVSSLKGIGPKKAVELVERGLAAIGDLLSLLPRTYEDRRRVVAIGALAPGALAVAKGTVAASGIVGRGRGRSRFEAVVEDGTGQVRLVFFRFRLAEMQKRFARGELVTFVGEVAQYGARLQMIHPKVAGGDKADLLGGVWPVYPELKGQHPQETARAVRAALDVVRATPPAEVLPAAILLRERLMSFVEALEDIHAPDDGIDDDALRALVERRAPAHRRLAFEELFVLGTALSLRRRAASADQAVALRSEEDGPALARALLPFTPTTAQTRAIGEVLADLERDAPMGRLLQGDVGSGKTAVAAVACLRAVRAGHQAAFMAPTELLAEQHGRTLKALLSPLGVRTDVVTGSSKGKARKLATARLATGDTQVVVGTHALLSDDVVFARLALCVIDEQHRFGVVQRAKLKAKGPLLDDVRRTPHLLVMTATPIPRSLALTAYGDLAVSVLDELPPGRQPIETKILDATRLHVAHDAVEAAMRRGERAYVVYPLIDESEKIDLAAATDGFQQLAARFGAARVALLHGRMDASTRDEAMARFASGAVSVLVSTTVIEVGVDVAAATLMVVMNAERFGLSQLHQLRGRIGRGTAPSRCLLVVGGASTEDAQRRLTIMEQTTDGFRIAEEDLAIRGPGDFMGTRQSGLPSLAFADITKHGALIERARALADKVVTGDPTLALPEHAALRRLVVGRYAERLALAAAG